ncbi:MAG: hypothetical protein M1337_04840 [Actinobacteria bacterium]|nr:hypothetical protein [Actinomycetota bacterium]
MGIVTRIRINHALLGALVAGLTFLTVACGGSSGSGTTTSSGVPPTTAPAATTTSAAPTTGSSVLAGEQATIAANWVKFFDGTVAAQDKIGLLENGQQYTKELDANAASPLAKLSTATVSAVTITSPTTATVTYSILVSSQPALPDQTGQAVKQNGAWTVSAKTFLDLLALQAGSASTTTTTS